MFADVAHADDADADGLHRITLVRNHPGKKIFRWSGLQPDKPAQADLLVGVWSSGRCKVKVVPAPSLLVTVICPPCASTMALQMARPRPLLLLARERALS